MMSILFAWPTVNRLTIAVNSVAVIAVSPAGGRKKSS
jgi:hypothetical protein